MKKGKIIGLCALGFLLAVILAALVIFYWYWPHYAMEKEAAVFDSGDSSHITMMSCNLRCLTPLDLGKKSWFYRADLITKDIESQAPRHYRLPGSHPLAISIHGGCAARLRQCHHLP